MGLHAAVQCVYNSGVDVFQVSKYQICLCTSVRQSQRDLFKRRDVMTVICGVSERLSVSQTRLRTPGQC